MASDPNTQNIRHVSPQQLLEREEKEYLERIEKEYQLDRQWEENFNSDPNRRVRRSVERRQLLEKEEKEYQRRLTFEAIKRNLNKDFNFIFVSELSCVSEIAADEISYVSKLTANP